MTEQKPYSIEEFNMYLEFIREAVKQGYQIRKEGKKIIIENDEEYFAIVPKKGKEQLIEDLWKECLKLKKYD